MLPSHSQQPVFGSGITLSMKRFSSALSMGL